MATRLCRALRLIESVYDAFSRGYPVDPPAEADERAGGPVDVPEPVQQPAPAAQRSRACEVADRLLHQRA